MAGLKVSSPTSLRQNNTDMGRKRTGQIKEIAPGRFRIKIQRGTGIRRVSFDETFLGTRETAEEYVLSCLETITEFETMPERAKTVADLMTDYIERRASPNVRAKTLLDKNNMLIRYIAPNLGDIPIRDLKAADVRKFYEDLRFGDFIAGFREKGVVKPRKAESGLSAQTIKKVHTNLKAAFAYAYEMEWLDRNPLANVVAPKAKRVNRRIPTIEEREKLFAACRSMGERALLMFAYFTGTRPEEYLAARWSDLNLETGQWSIERVKVEMPGGLKAILWEEPKTEKSRRRLPFVPRLVAILREYQLEQAAYRSKLGEKWQDNELVFPARHGTARLTSNVHRQFKELLKLAELPNSIRPYDLRHAFATHLLEGGATLKDVSELLGHSSIRVTADVYVQVSEQRKHSVVALLDNSELNAT